VRINKKYNVNELTDRLVKTRVSKPGEPVRFEAFVFNQVLSVLESAIDLRPEIPETDRRGILLEAVMAAGKDSLNPATLEKHLRRSEDTYLGRPKAQFMLASSLSIANTLPTSHHFLNSSQIKLIKTLPRRFSRATIQDRAASLVPGCPENLTQVVASVSSRSATAEFEEAKGNVDLLRALWNYSLTHNTRPIFFAFLDTRPLNPIVPGPLHTLHHPDGSLVEDVFWYERQRIETSWVFDARQQWPKIAKAGRGLRARLRAIPYGEDLENALVRYTRSLDEADSSTAFTRLWGVLEFLTGTVGRYDPLVSRAAFLSQEKDRTFVSLLLQHLRDVRNGLVHTDQSRSNVTTYLYQLKWVTEMVLRYHLRNGKRFSSLASAAEYLDTPTDRTVLVSRLRNFRLALGKRW
jgi:hypothetical protein